MLYTDPFKAFVELACIDKNAFEEVTIAEIWETKSEKGTRNPPIVELENVANDTIKDIADQQNIDIIQLSKMRV